jgi:3'-5' exoribonuclease
MTELRRMANYHGVTPIANKVLDNPKFRFWGGSSVDGAHHHYDGGLAEHTEEVARLCQHNKRVLNLDIDEAELFLAALFHDVGKMWDYQKNYGTGVWESTAHKRNIHHISRSGIEWMLASEGLFDMEKRERILHAILAHHGQRAFGSPVAPKSKMAWLLHQCDQISARMNDADTNDVLDRKN